MPTILEPNASTSPADGFRDLIAEGQAEDRTALLACDDDYSADLRTVGIDLLNAVESCRKILWMARDYHAKKMASAAAIMNAVADSAAASVQAGPMWTQADFQASQYGARQAERARIEATFRDATLTKYADPASQAGERLEAAFVACADEFDVCYSRWDGPAALARKPGSSLDSIFQEQSVLQELKSSKAPVREALKILTALVKDFTNNPDDEDAVRRLDTFVRPAMQLATEMKAMPPPKAAAMYGGERGLFDNERALAFQLLNSLDALKIQRRPKSLDVTASLLDHTRMRALQLTGVALPYSVQAEYDIRGRVPPAGETVATKVPWSLDKKSWFGRFIPPSIDAPALSGLTGWSPIVQKLSSGGYVRAPRG